MGISVVRRTVCFAGSVCGRQRATGRHMHLLYRRNPRRLINIRKYTIFLAGKVTGAQFHLLMSEQEESYGRHLEVMIKKAEWFTMVRS